MPNLTEFYTNLPKMRYKNVSGKTVPSFGVMRIKDIEGDSGLLLCESWQHAHPPGFHHTADHIEHLGFRSGGEWECVFNLATPVKPGKSGLCVTVFPSITRAHDDVLQLKYGDVVCPDAGTFEMVPSMHDEYPGDDILITPPEACNGWPIIGFIDRTPGQVLIVVGAIVSYEHFGHTDHDHYDSGTIDSDWDDWPGHPGPGEDDLEGLVEGSEGPPED